MEKMSIIDKVRNTITEYRLINRGERVLVALSGGSDSVAMLHILLLLSKELGFNLCAAHINHCLRDEADEDEKFVVGLCEELGIKCFTKKINVEKYANENSISCELAGRKIRYEFFDEIIRENSIDKLATAHNRNDSAESILLHMIRGCGIDGMCGIPAIRNGYIIRPVIDINKAEIEEYCRKNNLLFVVDKTNFETDYTRNKIRLNVIPEILENINRNFINTITENSLIFRETKNFIDNYTNEIYDKLSDGGKLQVDGLLSEDEIIIKNTVLLHFRRYTKKTENLSAHYVNEIIKVMKNGDFPKTINLPSAISARLEYGSLYFEETSKDRVDFEYDIICGVELLVPECDETIIIKEEKEINKNTRDKIYFYVDGDSEFKVRNRRNGDKFQPLGMKGTKKLSDFFIDLKVPVSKRDLILILTYDEEIVWVVGKRVDRRFSSGERLMSATITGRSID